MSRIETVSSDLKVLVRPGMVLAAQQEAPLPESPHQAAIAPDPVVEAAAPAPKRKRRARKADGTYQGDDPATPKNEAWID